MVACPQIIPRIVDFLEFSTTHEVPFPCSAMLTSEDSFASRT